MRLCLQTLCLALLALAMASEDKSADKDIGTVVGIDLGTTYSWYV